MNLNILLFGPLADAARSRIIWIHAAAAGPLNAQQVLQCIARQEPRLSDLLDGARLAVNGQFAGADQLVCESDELALIAQVSGG